MIKTTRDKLHEEVWNEPMTKVAERYGISDVGIKKICIKHRIPTPPRGYWARKKAGRKDKKTIYRQVSDITLNRILIHRSERGITPEELNERKARTRKKKQEAKQLIPDDTLGSPGEQHPLAERFHTRMTKKRPGYDGFITNRLKSCFQIHISPVSVERMTGFLSNFARVVKAAGHTLEPSDDGLLLRYEGEDITFELAEKTDRRPHQLTPKEEAELDKYKQYLKRREGRTAYDQWDWRDYVSEPRVVEFDYNPNGRLVFRFTDGGYDGLRRTFADGKTQTIEKLLPDILAGASCIADQMKMKREKERIQKLERKKQEEIARKQRRLKNLEKHRILTLEELMGKWRNAADIREFVEAVQARVARSDKPGIADAWTDWASKYADSLDPLTASIPRLARMEDFPSW